MLHESSYTEIRLCPGAVLSLDDAGGRELLCVAGRIWLTEAGADADVWLQPGERFRLTRPGRTVVEAVAGEVVLRVAQLGGDRLGTALLAAFSRWNASPARPSP